MARDGLALFSWLQKVSFFLKLFLKQQTSIHDHVMVTVEERRTNLEGGRTKMTDDHKRRFVLLETVVPLLLTEVT